MKVMRTIHSRSAKKYNIIPIEFEVYVLKAHFIRVGVAKIKQIANNAPIFHIIA